MKTARRRSASKRHLSLLTLCAVVATASAGKWLSAAAGDLDPTFGTAGVVLTDAAAPYCCEEANAVAIQADGRIVVAGSLFDTSNTQAADNDFALVRYHADGTPDPSFGVGGVVTTKFVPNSSDAAFSVAIQADGKIVAAGRTQLAGASYMAIARYLPDGSLDMTFHSDGRADLEFGRRLSEATAVAIQPDGRIVVAGRAWDNFTGDSDFALARLNPDGSLDLSFGVFGSVRTPFVDQPDLSDPFQQPYDVAQALVLQPDGKIVAAGYSALWPDFYGDMVIARYDAAGILDPAFGTAGDGKVRVEFHGNHDEVTGAALQPDGRILLAGRARNPNGGLRYEFAAARLDQNGVPDPTFDDDGKVTTRIEPLDAGGDAMALQSDGRFVVVGGYGNDFAVARYRSNGALDTSFSTDGLATFDRGGYESAGGVAIQDDGKIVTAGRALPITGGGNLATFLVVRFDGGGGMLEQTIDFAPLADRSFGDPPFTVSATATSGLPVTFTAAGACTISGFAITGSGACAITASQDGNTTYAPAPDLTRTFQVLNARALTITLAGTGTGHVGSFPDGIDCGADCSETYEDGTPVTLTPTASTGSSFVAFGGDADCSDGIVTLNTNVACTATFDRTTTTTTVSSSLNPSTYGAPVTFTVMVTGSSPGGAVTIRDGAVTLASGLALSSGSASLTLSTLTAGTHMVTAEYGGDTSNAGSTSSPLSQVVNKATPAVTLVSSRNPSAPGEAVTLSGTVPASATGTVTMFEGAIPLGEVPVSGGGYALTTSTLGVGSHTLRARYNGDDNYLAAESGSLTQVVETGNRAPQITPVPGQTVTWGFLLSIPVFASDADNDPLTFSLVAPPAGASISSGGQLTWTPTSAQVGPTGITVQVSDGQVTATASVNVTVTKRTTVLGYLGPGAASSGPLQLSARLTDMQNAPVAARTIAFQLGTQSASGTTDSTGLATASIVLNQPVGNVGVTTSFAGDGAYEASSSTLSFRIDASPVIAPIAPQSIPWGQMLSFIVDASDPEGGALTFSLLGAPAGVGLNFESATRRRVVWTPTAAQIGPTSITVGVSDGITTVSVTVAVNVLRQPAAITQIGPGAAPSLGPVVLTATLRAAVSGILLAGRPVTFALGSLAVNATTNATGVAMATIDIAQAPQTVPLVVSFGGDALYAPSQASQPFSIYGDMDADGLRDEWEINGVDVDGNGSIDLNLPAMGANPRRKDIFIEIDWMVKPSACVWLVCWNNGGVLQPQKAALDMLVHQFATAPVINPDGSTGISLHVDGGPATIMNPANGEPWGAMSRAGVAPYFPSLGTVDPFGNYDWSQFDSIKQGFFDPARRAVFHYVIYADTLAATNAGGISRGIPAADFAIAAGHPSWNGGLTVAQERSLFMHELGHNLSLHHGGADDLNYKPNYHSVLNYLWSLIGVPPDNRSDYSHVAEAAIDELAAGDVNGDGRFDTLLGYQDWPNLVLNGGGIGDLQALPPPLTTPMDPIDPDELRARGVYARGGDGLLTFKGPSLLVLNSGTQSLTVDVKNISEAAADYVVTAEIAFLAAPVSAAISVAATDAGRVTLPVNTAGLVAGEYIGAFTLRSLGGELLHQQSARIVVVDLTVPENQQAARDAIEALAALPPDSGLDPSIRDQVVRMFETAAVSWTAQVQVTGRAAFNALYSIEQPVIERAPGRITARSLPGTPLCELNLLRAGKAASGKVRLQRPSGELFEAPIAGSWNDSTRVFEGRWLDGKRTGGSIVFSLREP